MSLTHASIDADPERLRLVTGLSLEYILRATRDFQITTGLTHLETLVYAGIVAANNSSSLGSVPRVRPHAELPDPPAADERRPISVLSLAASLGLPPETTRRCVKRLESTGRVRRVAQGVVVVGTWGDDEQMNDFRRRNLANLKRLFRMLTWEGARLD